eukprot:Unigene6334_Nuclearia_a/m.19505 Unigene6334_Nuclearia_a/g.19505  ORF Unigene6334_Nuclearia_a/g.19505 Unigene6334_Nuclearia_a/m.19505 type:complete len:227 (-) Unigene6334_Nuclearia_a:42-722(-)
MTPAVHGLISEPADTRTNRALTLIAKIMQNLANIVGESAKEAAFMGEINAFVTDNMDEMRQFIRVLAMPPKQTTPTTSARLTLDLARELEEVRGTFEMLTSKILSHPTLVTQPSIAEIYGEVGRLGQRCVQLGAQPRSQIAGDTGMTMTLSPIISGPHTRAMVRAAVAGRTRADRPCAQHREETRNVPPLPLSPRAGAPTDTLAALAASPSAWTTPAGDSGSAVGN